MLDAAEALRDWGAERERERLAGSRPQSSTTRDSVVVMSSKSRWVSLADGHPTLLPTGLLSHRFYVPFYTEVTRMGNVPVKSGLQGAAKEDSLTGHAQKSNGPRDQRPRVGHAGMWDRAGYPAMWGKPCSPQKHQRV